MHVWYPARRYVGCPLSTQRLLQLLGSGWSSEVRGPHMPRTSRRGPGSHVDLRLQERYMECRIQCIAHSVYKQCVYKIIYIYIYKYVSYVYSYTDVLHSIYTYIHMVYRLYIYIYSTVCAHIRYIVYTVYIVCKVCGIWHLGIRLVLKPMVSEILVVLGLGNRV